MQRMTCARIRLSLQTWNKRTFSRSALMFREARSVRASLLQAAIAASPLTGSGP